MALQKYNYISNLKSFPKLMKLLQGIDLMILILLDIVNLHTLLGDHVQQHCILSTSDCSIKCWYHHHYVDHLYCGQFVREFYTKRKFQRVFASYKYWNVTNDWVRYICTIYNINISLYAYLTVYTASLLICVLNQR